ncbi:MAG: hypothetical protein RIQ67_1716 [Pseudomonadota bacterium]|jgi:hypothetical protein
MFCQTLAEFKNKNSTESIFSRIHCLIKRSNACLNHRGVEHMSFKLGRCGEGGRQRWSGFDYFANAIKGIKFIDGEEMTNVDQVAT